MAQHTNRPNNADIVRAWEQADPEVTMTEFGARYGISRERVRQIIEAWEIRHGVTIPRALDKRRAAREAAEKVAREAAERARQLAPNLVQRLLSKAVLVPESGCWLWRGSESVVGRFRRPHFSGLGEKYAHRVAYRLWRGEIPDGHVIVWDCGDRTCINPYHLSAVTHRESCERSPNWDSERGTWKFNQPRPPATHCAKGHEFTPENTAWNTVSETGPDGTRVKVRTRLCKMCLNERRKSYPPKPKPPPPPPLPKDYDERVLERAIRRIFNKSARSRLAALDALLAENPEDNHEPAEEQEHWFEYFHRIWRRGAGIWPSHEAWFRSRLLQDHRVRELLASKEEA